MRAQLLERLEHAGTSERREARQVLLAGRERTLGDRGVIRLDGCCRRGGAAKMLVDGPLIAIDVGGDRREIWNFRRTLASIDRSSDFFALRVIDRALLERRAQCHRGRIEL